MNVLLDTHIALWAITDHPNLPKIARDIISDPENTVFFSPISVWEILLKNDSP